MGKKSAYPLFLVNSGLPSKELLASSLLHPSHVSGMTTSVTHLTLLHDSY